MCDLTIIFNKNRKNIPVSFITKVALNQAKYNKDGTGILIHDGKRIRVWKSLKPYSNFEELEKWLANKNDAVLIAIHSRISTSGGVTEQNIHPLTKNKKDYVLHNGVINNTKETPDSLELLKNHYEIEGYANFIKVSEGSLNAIFGVQTRGETMYYEDNSEVLIYSTRASVFDEATEYILTTNKYFGYVEEEKTYDDGSGFIENFKKFKITKEKRFKINLLTYEVEKFDFKSKAPASKYQLAKTSGSYMSYYKGSSKGNDVNELNYGIEVEEYFPDDIELIEELRLQGRTDDEIYDYLLEKNGFKHCY